VERSQPAPPPSEISPALRPLFEDYAAHHQHRWNERCHMIGIPLIIVGTARLLAGVTLVRFAGTTVTLAELVLVALVAFYVVMDRSLGAVLAVLLSLLVALGESLPFAAGLTVFVLGWVAQFVGHYAFEHRAPAFARNLLHLLVGPAWIAARLLGWA
jgi:uncharacterized membrane protein YGL010W